MIKLADTLKAMSDFPVALADSIEFSDGANLQEKFDNKELGGGDSSITLTQTEYEALTEEEKLDGLYYTYDTKRIYKNGVQYGVSDAEDIGYNNAESGIQATTVQGAIDKVNDKVDNLIDDEVSDSTVWSSQKTSDEIAKVDTELKGNLGEIEEKIGNIDNLKLINLGENVDANNCRIAYGNINCVYGYCGYFTQNVPMKGYAVIRCYHYGTGIRQFIDYTASTARTYTRFIQYNGQTPTAWKELATMDKLGGLTFSASGTTLTITNGTNTWTLKANS